MRPQDIVILLKIISLGERYQQYRDLSVSLHISVSEVSASLNRSAMAGLIDASRKKVNRMALMEFIQYGLHYVFPQQPGAIVTGIATAHSHPFYSAHFNSELPYVWADPNGNIRGQAIEPLHPGVPKAAQEDDDLYLLLASVDILRVGRVREIRFALEQLKNKVL